MSENEIQENHRKSSRITYARILKYTGLLGIVQILQVLISVIRNKCAAVLIGRYGMGITDILNRTTDMFSSLTNLGLPTSGVRAISEKNEDRSSLVSAISVIRAWCFFTGIFGMVICALLSEKVNVLFFGGELPRYFIATVSPAVFFSAVYGGEIAILKGTRNLGKLASVTVYGTFISLIATVILYLALGTNGIPWAILSSSLAILVTALTVTQKLFPWNAKIFSISNIKAGKYLLSLGISYVAAGLAGSGAEMLVRSYISQGSLADVGLYASGFAICVTYTRIVFVAMDAEYFPRLSSLSHNIKERNITVSVQIDICCSLMAPMIIALLFSLPLLIEILYNSDFSGAVGMCICASGYLFLKAIIAPIEYIPLASNDAFTYFVMELIYDVVFVLSIIIGYGYFNIKGAGLALTASYLFDIILILIVYRIKYDFTIPAQTLRLISVHGCTVAFTVVVFLTGYGILQYILGAGAFVSSAVYALKELKITKHKIKDFLKYRFTKKQ